MLNRFDHQHPHRESKADLLLFPVPGIRHAEQLLEGTALTQPQPAKAARAVPFVSNQGCLGFIYIYPLLQPLGLTQIKCVRTQLLGESIASAVSPIIIITGKERGNTWLESIKTWACRMQEKYLFCIGKNVDTVTKSQEKQQDNTLLLLTCHTVRQRLWAFILRGDHQDLGLHSLKAPQSSISP